MSSALECAGGAWGAESISRLAKLAKPLEECSIEQLWQGHLQMELDSLQELEKRIMELETKLNAIGDADPRVIRVQTIPGVGRRLSELVVAMIDDPHRFNNARQIGAYAGLVPRRYQSGEMDRSGRISRAGCGKLRKVLVQVAWGMLRNNPHASGVFNQISKGQKSRRKQAIVAVARRVLCWSWAMLRDQTDWKTPPSLSSAMPRRATG